MFLDEKLLSICKDADIKESEDVISLHTKLIKESEVYYKSRISPGMTEVEVKAVIDRAFNLWVSFANMARSSEDKRLMLIGELCLTYTLRVAFMNDPLLKKAYEKL